MRFIAAPLIDTDVSVPIRLLRFLGWALTHPMDFLKALVLPGWAHNVTILLVMQHADNRMRFRMGRSLFTLFRHGMVAEREPGYEIHAQVKGSHELTREFAKRTDGITLGSIGENLLGLPTTAHILGGAPIGKDSSEGVVNENFEVHNYPGMYIIDGSIMPANPGRQSIADDHRIGRICNEQSRNKKMTYFLFLAVFAPFFAYFISRRYFDELKERRRWLFIIWGILEILAYLGYKAYGA